MPTPVTETHLSLAELADKARAIRRNALCMGEVQGQGYIAQALGIADEPLRELLDAKLPATFRPGPGSPVLAAKCYAASVASAGGGVGDSDSMLVSVVVSVTNAIVLSCVNASFT